MSGTVEAIWIKRFHRGQMDPVNEAELVAGAGIVGNADQGGRRQVTLVATEAWGAAVAELGADVEPAARRANVLVRGIELRESRGTVLRIGSVMLRILGETAPGHRMDEARRGLQAVLRPEWRAGAFAEVLQGGSMVVGDAVEMLEVQDRE